MGRLVSQNSPEAVGEGSAWVVGAIQAKALLRPTDRLQGIVPAVGEKVEAVAG